MEQYKKQIENFTKILFKIGKNYLINFKNNIKTLKIEENNFQNRPIDNAGSYNEKENKIYLRDLFSDNVIYHELFHLSSTKVIDETVYSGISISNEHQDYNIGINEGYTQLLTERYFPNNHSYTLSYPYELIIAKQIEIIIGTEKMLSSYLNASLAQFILELKKYLKDDEIKQLINNVDFIHNNLYKNKGVMLVKNKMQEVSNILLSAYQTKLEFMKISSKAEEINNFISNMDLSMKIANEEYEFFVPDNKVTKGGQR